MRNIKDKTIQRNYATTYAAKYWNPCSCNVPPDIVNRS